MCGLCVHRWKIYLKLRPHGSCFSTICVIIIFFLSDRCYHSKGSCTHCVRANIHKHVQSHTVSNICSTLSCSQASSPSMMTAIRVWFWVKPSMVLAIFDISSTSCFRTWWETRKRSMSKNICGYIQTPGHGFSPRGNLRFFKDAWKKNISVLMWERKLIELEQQPHNFKSKWNGPFPWQHNVISIHPWLDAMIPVHWYTFINPSLLSLCKLLAALCKRFLWELRTESATCHHVLQLSNKANPTTLAIAISTAFTVKFWGST